MTYGELRRRLEETQAAFEGADRLSDNECLRVIAEGVNALAILRAKELEARRESPESASKTHPA